MGRIALGSLGSLAVWQGSGDGNQDSDLYYAFLPHGSSRWSAPERVHDNAGRQIFPMPACTNAGCSVVWQEESSPASSDWAIFGAQVIPTVGPKVRLQTNDSGIRGQFPSVATIGSDGILAAWEESLDGAAGIRLVEWRPGQLNVSASWLLDELHATRPRTTPSISVGQVALVTWLEIAPPDGRNIRFTTASPDRMDWTPAERLSLDLPPRNTHHPRAVTMPSGGVGVTWEDGTVGPLRIRLAVLDSGNLGWTEVGIPGAENADLQVDALGRSQDGEFALFFKQTEDYRARLVLASSADRRPMEVQVKGESPGVDVLSSAFLVFAAVVALSWQRR